MEEILSFLDFFALTHVFLLLTFYMTESVFRYLQIGDYLLTLPQQLEPFITQENPALEVAMKTGNLPFPDLQGTVFTATGVSARKGETRFTSESVRYIRVLAFSFNIYRFPKRKKDPLLHAWTW